MFTGLLSLKNYYFNVSENQLFPWLKIWFCSLAEGIKENVWTLLVKQANSWLWTTEHLSNRSFIKWNDNRSFVGPNPSFNILVNWFICSYWIKRSENLNRSLYFSDLSDIISLELWKMYCWSHQKQPILQFVFRLHLRHLRGKLLKPFLQFIIVRKQLDQLEPMGLLFF